MDLARLPPAEQDRGDLMYVRKATRRRFNRLAILLLAVVVLTPKFEAAAVPQFTALLDAVGLGFPQSG